MMSDVRVTNGRTDRQTHTQSDRQDLEVFRLNSDLQSQLITLYTNYTITEITPLMYFILFRLLQYGHGKSTVIYYHCRIIYIIYAFFSCQFINLFIYLFIYIFFITCIDKVVEPTYKPRLLTFSKHGNPGAFRLAVGKASCDWLREGSGGEGEGLTHL